MMVMMEMRGCAGREVGAVIVIVVFARILDGDDDNVRHIGKLVLVPNVSVGDC